MWIARGGDDMHIIRIGIYDSRETAGGSKVAGVEISIPFDLYIPVA